MADDLFRNFSLPSIDDGPRRHADSVARMNSQIMRAAEERIGREQVIAGAADFSMRAASIATEHITDEIAAFEQSLASNEELFVFVVGGPAGQTFFPTTLRALDPDKIAFGGEDADGRPFLVVQHVSQLNFALQVHALPPEEEGRRIGFAIPGED